MVVFAAASVQAASLSPLSSFGGGDGWRAPGENLTGDSVATVPYPYLGTGNLERGLAYNPVSGNLILVSRSTAGNGIRILDGTTGVDEGALAQGSGIITGGTFTTNQVGVGSDGAIYVSNLASPLSANTAFKIYRWGSEADAAPTLAFTSNTLTTGRLGDSFDVIGSGANTRIVAGESNSAGTGARNGYAIIDPTAGTGTLVAFTGTPPNAGDYRLGITFAGADDQVWGKIAGAGSVIRRSSYSGAAGTFLGSSTTASAGESPMDYAVINGTPYLALLDANNSTLRVYDATDPTNLLVVASGTTTAGTLTANANATGSVKWGAISGVTATVYAMNSNQGIQAFTFVVPEPTTLAGLAGLSLFTARRRK